MDRAHFELIGPFRLADLYREAERERLVAAAPRRRRRPPLPALGRRLIQAGEWMQQFDRACVDCPAPALP